MCKEFCNCVEKALNKIGTLFKPQNERKGFSPFSVNTLRSIPVGGVVQMFKQLFQLLIS